MKREINLLTLTYLLVLLFLFASGMFDGALSIIIYILGFALPLFLALYLSREYREGDGKEYLTLDARAAVMTAPLLFIVVGVAFLFSYVSALIMGALFGVKSAVDLSAGFGISLITHALLPAFLEEALFRYLPMKLLLRRSVRVTVILSASFFALLHHSFLQIPYAFAAGLIFIAIDIIADSVLPSVILHFLNNVISIVWSFYIGGTEFAVPFIISVGVLFVLSVLSVLLLYGRLYRDGVKRLTSRGEPYGVGYYPLLFVLPTLFIAVTELFV